VRFSQSLWDCLRVDVHGRSYVGVAQQFLLHLDVNTERSQKSRIRVTKCVPADPPDTGRYSRRNKIMFL
jgi:hypothetical protein